METSDLWGYKLIFDNFEVVDATDKVMFHAQDTGITPGTEVKVMIVVVYKNFAPSYAKTVKCTVMPACKNSAFSYAQSTSLPNMYALIFLARFLPVKCTPEKVKRPYKPDVIPLSGSQALIVWRKDLGPGYNFKVTVKQGETLIKTVSGPTGFGNSKAVIVNGLKHDILYNFTMQHECTSQLGTFSKGKSVEATTLGEGNRFWGDSERI